MDRPPGGWNDLVTNQTLDLKIDALRSDLRSEMSGLRSEMVESRSEMTVLRSELRGKIVELNVSVDRRLRAQTWITTTTMLTAVGLVAAFRGSEAQPASAATTWSIARVSAATSSGRSPGTSRCAAGCGRACGRARCRRCRWHAASSATAAASTASSKSIVPTTWRARAPGRRRTAWRTRAPRPSRRRVAADSVAAAGGELEAAVGEHPLDLLGRAGTSWRAPACCTSGRGGSSRARSARSRDGGHPAAPRLIALDALDRRGRHQREPQPAVARRSTSAARSSRRRTARGSTRRPPARRRRVDEHERVGVGALGAARRRSSRRWTSRCAARRRRRRPRRPRAAGACPAPPRSRSGRRGRGARAVTAANLEENSPKTRCWLRRSIRPNVGGVPERGGPAVAEQRPRSRRGGRTGRRGRPRTGPTTERDAGLRWRGAEVAVGAAASAATGSRRTLLGPEPNRPSPGSRSGGRTMLVGSAGIARGYR